MVFKKNMKCNIIEFWIEKVKLTIVFFLLNKSEVNNQYIFQQNELQKNTQAISLVLMLDYNYIKSSYK